MHDIRAIRDDPEGFDRGLSRRGEPPAAEAVLAIDAARRASVAEAEQLRVEMKQVRGRGVPPEMLPDDYRQGSENAWRWKARAFRERVKQLEDEIRDFDREVRDLLLSIPNLPDADVPDGPDESANVEIRRWGEPPALPFAPREHFDLPAAQGLDFETGASLSGSRFVVLRGAMARLHRALVQFMLQVHLDAGREEVWAPFLVREEMMVGTGQLPKFGEDSYRTEDGLWLVPTNEVTLTNTVRERILDEACLPMRLCGHAHCFRSEAGSAGRDTKGMLRQHQFEKVEMVSITQPEDSRAELDRMTEAAQGILERLGLPYRTVVLCAGDMGFGARRTHDIEVWLPGQNTYREISSVSDTGAFQARRMNARFRPGGGKPEFVHTLNGSGLAVGRTLIAVLENGQREDGSVALPKALHPWIDATEITAEGHLK